MRHALAATLLLSAGLPALAAERAKPNTLTPKEIAEGWILLFDGETPFGWDIEGDAKVAEGALVLGNKKKTTASPTSWFGDYEVRLECRKRGDKPAQFGPYFANGGESTWCEEKEWTQYTITADTKGTMKIRGSGSTGGDKIGNTAGASRLRVEASAGSKFELRNVKLKPFGLKPIFNGKDLTGWKEVKTERTKSKFAVTDRGELSVKNGPGDIQTEAQWDDFVLQLECISHGKYLNSGVFFRCLRGKFWSGYEAQIRNQWEGEDRTKPVDYGTGGIYNRQPARKVVSSDNKWFTMTVAARGKHLAVWVNGYQTADFTDNRPPDKSARKGSKVGKGPISLQGHDKTTDLSFRNMRIAALPKVKQ
jgi:hypothetical protein